MSGSQARTAVIPLAGLGTRMQPLARSVPKEMLPLGDRPILHHVIEELVGAGVDHIVLVVGSNGDTIRRYLDVIPELDERLGAGGRIRQDDPLWARLLRCKYTFVEQSHARGVADAVYQARHNVGEEPYFVHMGDTIILNDTGLLQRMQRSYRTTDADMVVSVGDRLAHPSTAKAVAEPKHRSESLIEPYAVSRVLEGPPAGGPAMPFVIGRFLLRGPMAPWTGRPPGFGRLGGLGRLLADDIAARVTAVPLLVGERVLGGGTLPEYHASWREWLREATPG
jgi:UTP--glucose-1-phosphate uridylyltransferase